MGRHSSDKAKAPWWFPRTFLAAVRERAAYLGLTSTDYMRGLAEADMAGAGDDRKEDGR